MSIKINQNMTDRFLRIVLGGALMVITSYFDMSAVLTVVLMIAGLYLMFSGLAGHCFIYQLLRINTCK